jgi:hypothetical protein
MAPGYGVQPRAESPRRRAPWQRHGTAGGIGEYKQVSRELCVCMHERVRTRVEDAGCACIQAGPKIVEYLAMVVTQSLVCG